MLAAAGIVVGGGCSLTSNFCEYVDNGFKVGPNYRRPFAEVESNWIDAQNPETDGELGSKINNDLPRLNHWWVVFNDPQLNELVVTAYQQNLPLREAGLRVTESRAQRGIAVGAFFPQQQEVFGNYRRRQISKASLEDRPLFDSNVPRTFNRWSTGFDAAWELDVWGKFRRNIETADALVGASVEDYNDILVCLIAETAATYVEMRTLQQRITYAEENVKAQKGLLGIAESRYKAGETDDLDVLQAQINVSNTEALVPEFKALERKAQIRLCVLQGVPPRDLTPELGPGAIPVAPPEVALGIPADLLRRRPDVRKAEREVAAQNAQIGVAESDFLPQFAIRGSIGYDARDFSELFTSPSNAGLLAPGFSWDVLNYGRILNNVEVQDARFRQRVLHYRQTVLRANAEAEKAIVSFLQAQQRVKSLKEAVAANEEAIKVATDQYNEGEINFNEIFTLQSFLVQEQDALAVAEGDVAKSLIAIYKALGGGWQIRCACAHSTLVHTTELIEQVPIDAEPPGTDLETTDMQIMPPVEVESIEPL